MRTIPIVNLPGSFPAAAARSGGRIVRAVGDAYTAALGNWAPASRPVRAPGGVYTGRRYDVVRKEGAQDGDSRSSLTGAGRGWRGVPGAGRVSPAGAPISSGRMWTGRRERHSRRDRLPMLREMRSERLMTSKGLFRESADHGDRWRNPVTVGAFRA